LTGTRLWRPFNRTNARLDPAFDCDLLFAQEQVS
jgi:hypothetical protein